MRSLVVVEGCQVQPGDGRPCSRYSSILRPVDSSSLTERPLSCDCRKGLTITCLPHQRRCPSLACEPPRTRRRRPRWPPDAKPFARFMSEGCFVIPNPWDVGSARYLEHLGFQALATTSAGFAFSQGLPDSMDAVVVSPRRAFATSPSIMAAVNLPVIADFMSGYGLSRRTWARASVCASRRGSRGSQSRTPPATSSPLYELPMRSSACAPRAGHRSIGEDVLLTARAECYHVGHPDPFPETSPPAAGVRRGGRGRALRPGPAESRGHQGAGRRGCAEAPQPPRGPGHWPECRRHCGPRRATHQRRRRVRIGGVDRLHPRRADVEVGGQFRRPGEPGAIREINGLFARTFPGARPNEGGRREHRCVADVERRAANPCRRS